MGDGTVIENASVLVRDGQHRGDLPGRRAGCGAIRAEVVEGAGKTLLPGLIDAHVHLAPTGGISFVAEDNDPQKTMPHAAAALLYSGVTAARSVGDGLDASLALRAEIAIRQQAGRPAVRLRPHVHHRTRATAPSFCKTFPRRCGRPCRRNWCARPRRPKRRAAR